MVVAICFFSNVHICNDLFVYSVWSTFLTTFLRTFFSALRQEYFFGSSYQEGVFCQPKK